MEYGIDITSELNDEFVLPLVEEATRLLAEKLDTGEAVTELTAYYAASGDPIISFDLESDASDAQSRANAAAVDALARLYELNDGDEAAVGELLYAIDKAARRKAGG